MCNTFKDLFFKTKIQFRPKNTNQLNLSHHTTISLPELLTIYQIKIKFNTIGQRANIKKRTITSFNREHTFMWVVKCDLFWIFY